MTNTNVKAGGRQPESILSTGADTLMSAKQAETLRALAKDALEHEAFRETLTSSEAALRIAMLKAKLKLMSEPPHTA